jgi:hypothetical protein
MSSGEEPLAPALACLARAAARQLRSSPELRSAARRVALWLAEQLADEPEVAAPAAAHDREASPGERPAEVEAAPPAALIPAEPPIDAGALARALRNGIGAGAVSPRAEAAGPVGRPVELPTSIDLPIMQQRCELKAEAFRFAIDRNAAGRPREAYDAERYEALRARADTMQPCYLWGISGETARLDEGTLECCEGCCRNLATAIGLAVGFDPGGGSAEVLGLLAEAQSAVWAALLAAGANRPDPDQQRVWSWVRSRAGILQIRLEHLSSERLADPGAWRGLHSRLAAAGERLRERAQLAKRRQAALNKVRYHVEQLGGSEDDETLRHWSKVTEGIAEFLRSGGAASDRDLVGLLLGVADQVPEGVAETELRLVLPYVDERAAAEEESGADAPPERAVTEEVLRARALLRGRVLVLIGGKCRPLSKRQIERELELRELRWISSDPHESISRFEPDVAHRETDAVLLAIRWSSHSFEGVKEMCDRAGKPFIRLPAGYGVNQIAHQVLDQQGERLAAAGPRA